jgi:hypothetical protein
MDFLRHGGTMAVNTQQEVSNNPEEVRISPSAWSASEWLHWKNHLFFYHF